MMPPLSILVHKPVSCNLDVSTIPALCQHHAKQRCYLPSHSDENVWEIVRFFPPQCESLGLKQYCSWFCTQLIRGFSEHHSPYQCSSELSLLANGIQVCRFILAWCYVLSPHQKKCAHLSCCICPDWCLRTVVSCFGGLPCSVVWKHENWCWAPCKMWFCMILNLQGVTISMKANKISSE